MRAKTRAHSRWNCAIRIAGIHGLKRNSLAIFSFYDAFLFAHDFHFGFNAHSCTWPLKKAHWAPFLAGKSQPIKSRDIKQGNYSRRDFRIDFHNEDKPPTLRDTNRTRVSQIWALSGFIFAHASNFPSGWFPITCRIIFLKGAKIGNRLRPIFHFLPIKNRISR